MRLITLLFFLLPCLASHSQVLLSTSLPVTENFDGMAATLVLPANWKTHRSATPTWTGGTTALTQQASSGSPVTGGAYNWGSVATERAAGVMSSGSFASPSSMMAWLQNAHSTDVISQVDVSYDLERYRINTAAASVQFYYSTDGSTWYAATAGDVPAASLPTGSNGYGFNPPNLTINVTTFSVTGFSIPPGGDLYLRWNLNTTGTNSQGIGIDNVTVTPYFCTPPVLVSAPANTGVCSGNNASFSVVSSSPGVTYQWQLSTDGGVTWSNLSDNATYSGSVLDVLSITAPPVGMNNYRYRCILTLAGCNLYSSAGILNVLANPVINQQPQNYTGPVGSNAAFFVSTSGASTFQWQESTDGGATWTNLTNVPPYSGCTTSSLLVSGINAGMNGYQYRCQVSGCSQTINSNGATLTIGAAAGTVFQPGDMIFIGYDTKVGTGSGCSSNAGSDRYYILTLVDIAPNTSFKIVNSRFESGAAANVRTNRWYGSGSNAYLPPDYVSLTWTGASTITKGSILAVVSSSVPSTVTEVYVNGVASIANFTVATQGSVNISSTAPDQIYLVQGNFIPFGTQGNSGYYNLFNGKVLFGLTNFANWVPLSAACSAGTNNSDRVSRLPDDIECFNLFSVTNREVYYYVNSANHVGTHRQLLLDIMNTVNWSQPASTSCLDITEDYSGATGAAIGKLFTVNIGNAFGTWIGDVNTDWFNCRNWEGLTVPDGSIDATVSALAQRDCQVDVNTYATTAAKFNNLAQCKNLLVSANKLIAEGSASNVISVGGFLRISGTGLLDMDDGNAGTADGKVYLTGLWINQVGDAAFLEGNSTIYFLGNVNQTISTSLGVETFANVYLDNTMGLKIFNAVNINTNFIMVNGIITASDTINDVLTFKDDATVTGTSNASFSASRVSKEGNDAFTFPVGETGWGYRPIGMSAPASTTDIFSAEYIRDNARLLGPVTAGGLNHVSACEYWILDRDAGTSTVDLTATYDANSCGITNLADLVIAHFDENGSVSWDSYGTIGSATGTPTAGTVMWYGVSTFSPFSLGSISGENPLPVEWMSFNGHREGDLVRLEWKTATETNSDRFDILRSSDGKNFVKAGEMDAAGNSSQPILYSFSDPVAGQTGMLYYKLRQVDFDGRENYTGTIAILLQAKGIRLLAGPNPVRDRLELSVFTENQATPAYSLRNSLGQDVMNGTLNLENGLNRFSVDVSTLAPGLYFFDLLGNDRQYLKLLIQ